MSLFPLAAPLVQITSDVIGTPFVRANERVLKLVARAVDPVENTSVQRIVLYGGPAYLPYELMDR